MTKQLAARRTAKQWKVLVDQQANSGQSARLFCEAQGVAYASFCNWRRRLSEIEPSPLIDIGALLAQHSDRTWCIELDLGEGIKLTLKQA
jgi:putative transposase